jgi:hypothetical protein
MMPGFAAAPHGGIEPTADSDSIGTVQVHNLEALVIGGGSCCIAGEKAAIRCGRTPMNGRSAAARDERALPTLHFEYPGLTRKRQAGPIVIRSGKIWTE